MTCMGPNPRGNAQFDSSSFSNGWQVVEVDGGGCGMSCGMGTNSVYGFKGDVPIASAELNGVAWGHF